MPDNLDISNNTQVVNDCSQEIVCNSEQFKIADVSIKACNGIVGDDNCSDIYAKGVSAAQKYKSMLIALSKNMLEISKILDGADQSVANSESGK